METESQPRSNEYNNEMVLEFAEPLYYDFEKFEVGNLTRLALDPANWTFRATQTTGQQYLLSHESGVSFRAQIKKGTGKKKGTYKIQGCVENTAEMDGSFFDQVNIQGKGDQGLQLRPAQLGAIYSLMAHWSLSDDVATVVLPTGTGKTETMLVTTLADRAKRTLIISPTVDLKDQIAGKFATWGLLRRMNVIPQSAPNPAILVLKKTLTTAKDIEAVLLADVVITTPGLIARATPQITPSLPTLFSHVYFDEAHHTPAAEWNLLKSTFSGSKLVQFTATPYRTDRKPIEGKIVYNYPLSQALKDNCFSKISLVTVDERHPRMKDKAIADAAIDRLNEDRAKGWTRHRVMVRANNLIHAEQLYSAYHEWFPSERIALVHSKTKNKKSIIQGIRDGAYDIVVCVDMLKEGFDYPDLKIAAVHSVHKSLAVLLQFIGRFTRVEEGLGDASFIVNYAEENISTELENLFQEGSGWEEVISEIADEKKAEAESLLSFLQACKPYSGFDSPDIELNPKLVYPALSCVCYHTETVDWSRFKDVYNLNKYALSQPFENAEEKVFYFTTQKREKVKWARTDQIRDQTWGLVAMHHDPASKLLYIGYSEKRLDVAGLVEAITDGNGIAINGDCVFRSFDAIKRLSIVHAGIFKPANHLHRYSRLSGADVTTELTRWKNGGKCQKSDFVGVGFRDGFPVSVGASVKGKIWSPARAGDLKEWRAWCRAMGELITDANIDSNQLLEESATKTEIDTYPSELVVLAADWSESLYERMHKLTLQGPNLSSIMLVETSLKYQSIKDATAEFVLTIVDQQLSFSITLGGDSGHSVEGLDECDVVVEGLKSDPISLTQFFHENPPTLFLLNGCTISGCVHTNYNEAEVQNIPTESIEVLDWTNVDPTIESHFKGSSPREHSIQEFMMKLMIDRGASIVFNDDNAGESADIVAIFENADVIRFELIHCKYSKQQSGARKSDLYEVCGQAIVSLRYKWKPEELLKHLERRNGNGVLKDKRFYHGNLEKLEEIRKALKYSDISFEFAIAQPGVANAELTPDMRNLLGSVYSTIVEMTETKLRCYFSS